MIGAATGIKRTFYAAFAIFLQDNGYGVITFDNEGIGESLTSNIKNSNASLTSWGQSDLSAIFSLLKTEFPNTKYHLIGHSAGGQLVGLMNGATELSSILNFACSSGSLRNMNYPFKIKAHFFMNFFMPISNLFFGFANNRWLGMGQPLPKKCAQQWTKWCNGTGYIETHLNNHEIEHYYDEINCPSLWINAIDDDIANDKNVKDMIRVFTKTQAQRLTLHPKEYQYEEIGHMKFFSKRHAQLWSIALEWLEQKY